MPHAHVGSVLGHYRIVGHLGSGAMSEVYRGLDPELNIEVAVKVISDTLLQNPDMVDRFKREAQAAAQLTHPNVARVFYFNFKGNKPFYAMELIRGCSLGAVIERRQRFSLAQFLELFAQAARGLRAASGRGIIHRDIKPGNLMVGEDGLLKIVDFGLAKLMEEDPGLTTSGTMMGTPYYVSPEAIRGEGVDHRSDIYSLGVTFYHLLVGVPPYDADTAYAVMSQHVSSPVPDPLRANPRLPEAIAGLLTRMMAKDVRRRPADYDALLREIDAARSTLGTALADEIAWCDHDRVNAAIRDGRCGLCRAQLVRRKVADKADLVLTGWHGTGAVERTVDYLSRALNRGPDAVQGMLRSLPVKLGHKLPFERAKRIQRTFYELGADVEVRAIEDATARNWDERLAFPLGDHPPPAADVASPAGDPGTGHGTGAPGRASRRGGPRGQRLQLVLIAVLVVLVAVLAVQVWSLREGEGPSATAAPGATGPGSGTTSAAPPPARTGTAAPAPPSDLAGSLAPGATPPGTAGFEVVERRGRDPGRVEAAATEALAEASRLVDPVLGAAGAPIPAVLDFTAPLTREGDPHAWDDLEAGARLTFPLEAVSAADPAIRPAARALYARASVRRAAAGRDVPPWLAAGLALHFEGLGTEEPPSPVETFFGEDARFPLKFWGPASRARSADHAARCQSLAGYLLSGPEGPGRVRSLLAALGSGVSLDEALATSHGVTSTALQSRWLVWAVNRP